MVQSKAHDVDSYLEEVPADRREARERLRKLVRSTFKGYVEGMDYGMPCYLKDGAMGAAFASQKNYIALYLCYQDAVNEFRDKLKGAKIGKGCIRYTKPEQIDFAVIKSLLTAAAKSPPPKGCR